MASGGESVHTDIEHDDGVPLYFVHAKEDIGKNERVNRKYFNDRIKKSIGIDFDVLSDPWCALWVGVELEEAGYPSTKKANARSYLEWGQAVTKGDWKQGDIIVFWRGSRNDGVTGHIGFIVSCTEDNVVVLGGNQGDEVCTQKFPLTKVLGVRRYRSAWSSHTIRTSIATGAAGAAEVVRSSLPTVETVSDSKTLLEQAMGYFPTMGHMLGVAIIGCGAYVIYRKLKEMKHV